MEAAAQQAHHLRVVQREPLRPQQASPVRRNRLSPILRRRPGSPERRLCEVQGVSAEELKELRSEHVHDARLDAGEHAPLPSKNRLGRPASLERTNLLQRSVMYAVLPVEVVDRRSLVEDTVSVMVFARVEV